MFAFTLPTLFHIYAHANGSPYIYIYYMTEGIYIYIPPNAPMCHPQSCSALYFPSPNLPSNCPPTILQLTSGAHHCPQLPSSALQQTSTAQLPSNDIVMHQHHNLEQIGQHHGQEPILTQVQQICQQEVQRHILPVMMAMNQGFQQQCSGLLTIAQMMQAGFQQQAMFSHQQLQKTSTSMPVLNEHHTNNQDLPSPGLNKSVGQRKMIDIRRSGMEGNLNQWDVWQGRNISGE